MAVQTLNAIFCLNGHEDSEVCKIGQNYSRVLIPVAYEYLLIDCKLHIEILPDLLKTLTSLVIVQKGISNELLVLDLVINLLMVFQKECRHDNLIAVEMLAILSAKPLLFKTFLSTIDEQFRQSIQALLSTTINNPMLDASKK